jgi:bifunctional DNase/RNase
VLKVECEILGLSAGPTSSGSYALLLKEVYGNRRIPIIIGQFEAHAIALEMEGIKPPRPLTHDLMKNIIDNLGATVIEVVVTELRDNTFYAKIVVETSGLTNEIDSRPSDAIALAVRAKVPIYVSEIVMQEASFVPSEEQEFDRRSNAEYDEQESISSSPKSKEAKIAALQDKLREAIEKEDYERAAKIRDEIKRLTSNN